MKFPHVMAALAAGRKRERGSSRGKDRSLQLNMSVSFVEQREQRKLGRAGDAGRSRKSNLEMGRRLVSMPWLAFWSEPARTAFQMRTSSLWFHGI